MLGRKFLTNSSGECTIIEYVNNKDVLVEFSNPYYTTKCAIKELVKGEVKNPLVPSFYEKGYVGVGEYKLNTSKRESRLWGGILKRLFSEEYHKTHPTYKNVEVCDEWLNFQNFAEWCNSQDFLHYTDNTGKYYQLDKDILVKGNKIYSPETCCFVPQEINLLLVNKKRDRGLYPIGVSKNKNKYMVNLTKGHNRIYLGRYKTPEEAFLVYKEAKESHIKEVTAMWKSRISDQTYQALMNWEINIDD